MRFKSKQVYVQQFGFCFIIMLLLLLYSRNNYELWLFGARMLRDKPNITKVLNDIFQNEEIKSNNEIRNSILTSTDPGPFFVCYLLTEDAANKYLNSWTSFGGKGFVKKIYCLSCDHLTCHCSKSSCDLKLCSCKNR